MEVPIVQTFPLPSGYVRLILYANLRIVGLARNHTPLKLRQMAQYGKFRWRISRI